MTKDSARTARVKTTLFVGVGFAAAGLLVGTTVVFAPQPASATPQFMQQTGRPCNFCHTNPAGGKDLTAAGKQFKAKGNKL
jgi:hypothetical protein